ncbi:MAG: response regulator, partial [Polyangiaceae bacterium]
LLSTATHASAYVEEAVLWSALDSVPPARRSSRPPGSAESDADVERAHILLADDNADMRDYVGRLLGERHDVTTARDGTSALAAALEAPPDLIVSDAMMPGMDGFALIGSLRAHPKTRDIPVILLSARAGEESAVEGLNAGADDYLAKPFSARELLARVQTHLDLSRTRRRFAEESMRKATAKAVRISEAKLRRVIDSAIVGVLVATPDGNVVQANDAYLRILGYEREDVLAGRVHRDTITPVEWAAQDEAALAELRATGTLRLREKEYIRKDGRRVPVLIGGAMVEHEYVGYVVDLSELHLARTALRESQEALRRSEQQLRQSQKMEAIGLLAGGVAHDFNNLLSVILTCAEFALADLPETAKIRRDVEEIREAGRRAGELTRQLLMFSRQQIIAPKVIDPNGLLMSMHKLLERIVGEDIDLVAVSPASVGKVRVDPSSLEQVIMNLVVNARDAMPAGGKLTIETANVSLDAGYADRNLGVVPGPYVMLAVSDTGSGMDKATQARIFEPFFTTKEKGRGTGLGLSTVFGIVQQSGGNVWVYSEPGNGTTFKIYLPQVSDELDTTDVQPSSLSLHGTETVLLVEDEDLVRAAARGILGRYGYDVIEARNGAEALRVCQDSALSIDLLLTDVVMPRMSGPALAKLAAALRPSMKVLCMSGYTDDSVVRHGLMAGEIAFVQKPFTPDSLGRKVRELLDSNRELESRSAAAGT